MRYLKIILIFLFWHLSSLAENGDIAQKTVLEYGILQGHVIVPEGIDPSTLVVQMAGVDNFNQSKEDFYTFVDKNGHYSFENTFPVGSSLNLVFWDQQGLLNKRVMPVYVSSFNGSYDVVLEKSTELTKTSGFCGKITGLSEDEILGSQVYVQDKKAQNVWNAKYFDWSNLNQNYLSKNGKFCFFNLDSVDNTSIYYLRLKLNNGSFKTFFVYLPPFTFASELEFDATSALFRPINNTAQNSYNLSLSTSYDYAAINYSENNSVYFPLSDEFLNIDYSFVQDNENRFYIFEPRSALFDKKIIDSLTDYSPGKMIVANNDDLALYMPNLQSIVDKVTNEKYGSLYLNYNTSAFKFDTSKIRFYLKDISGNEVSYFEGINNENEINGVFYNIPEGLFQLFVTVPTAVANCDNCTTINTNEKLLWTSLVESLANKTQVLSNEKQNENLVAQKAVVYVAQAPKQNSVVEVIPTGIQGQEETMAEKTAYLKAHSLFYKLNEEQLCLVPIAHSDKIPSFVDYVPVVSLMSPANFTYYISSISDEIAFRV